MKFTCLPLPAVLLLAACSQGIVVEGQDLPTSGGVYQDGVGLRAEAHSAGPQYIDVDVYVANTRTLNHVTVIASADPSLMDYSPVRQEVGTIDPSREPLHLVIRARPHTPGSYRLSVGLVFEDTLKDGPQALYLPIRVNWEGNGLLVTPP